MQKKKQNDYNTKIEQWKKDILNKEIKNQRSRDNHFSVLSYITKYCNMNQGVYTDSYKVIFKRYKDYDGHPRMCIQYFKKIIIRLCDLGLIFINRYKNQNVYSILQEVAEKVAQKIKAQNPNYRGMRAVEPKGQILKSIDLYTDTDIEQLIDYYKKSYAGISGKRTATKKDLVEIAKTLMSMRTIHQADVQAMVFRKIYTLQQKINAKGAVSYVNKLIMEKYEECQFIRSKVNPNINPNYEKHLVSLEKQLLGWD